MTLSFPNPSRSFDAAKNRILFWGYDSAIEVSFYMEADALKIISPNVSLSEADYLRAFDVARKRIYEVANEVYLRGAKGIYSYILASKDF